MGGGVLLCDSTVTLNQFINLLSMLISQTNWSTTLKFIINISFASFSFKKCHCPPIHSSTINSFITKMSYKQWMSLGTFLAVNKLITTCCFRCADIADTIDSIAMAIDKNRYKFVVGKWSYQMAVMTLHTLFLFFCFVQVHITYQLTHVYWQHKHLGKN